MPTRKTDEYTVAYKDDEKTKQAVFDMLVTWYMYHGAFDGESIMQNDGPVIESPEILSKIAKRIGFKVKYEDV